MTLSCPKCGREVKLDLTNAYIECDLPSSISKGKHPSPSAYIMKCPDCTTEVSFPRRSDGLSTDSEKAESAALGTST